MANNTSIPIIVQGNSYTLSIPLQVYYVDDDEMVLRDYTPEVTDKVAVQLKGERRSYTYTPTIDGSTALVELAGTELADRYAVMVSIIKDNGQRLRSYRTDQFFIVESSDDLTTDDIIQGLEENVIYLNSSIFVAGEQGEQGEQGVGISSIAKTATSGLVDTYTITLSNGQTSTFEVTNGQDGHDLGLAGIVNNLTDGGEEDALSAEMGKVINSVLDITSSSEAVTKSLTPSEIGEHKGYLTQSKINSNETSSEQRRYSDPIHLKAGDILYIKASTPDNVYLLAKYVEGATQNALKILQGASSSWSDIKETTYTATEEFDALVGWYWQGDIEIKITTQEDVSTSKLDDLESDVNGMVDVLEYSNAARVETSPIELTENEGYYRYASGNPASIESSANYRYSDFFNLKAGDVINIDVKNVPTSVCVLLRKEATGIRSLAKGSNDTQHITYTVPYDAQFAVSWLASTGITITKTSTLYGKSERLDDIEDAIVNVGDIVDLDAAVFSNVADDMTTDIVDGKFIAHNGTFGPNSSFAYKEFSVKNGAVIQGQVGSHGSIAILSKKTSTGYEELVAGTAQTAESFSYTATENMTVAVSFSKNSTRSITINTQMVASNTANIDKIFTTLDRTKIPNYGLMFDKVAVIGDSLSVGTLDAISGTDGHAAGGSYGCSWLTCLAKRWGSYVRMHYGRGGTTCYDWIGSNAFGLGLMLKDSVVYDVYFIAYGHNDYSSQASIGTTSDSPTEVTVDENNDVTVVPTSSAQTTFMGNYKRIVNEIRAKAPNALIFMMSTYDKDSESGIGSMNAHIKELAEWYYAQGDHRVFFLNYADKTDITRGTAGYGGTGGHFTTFGYAYVADVINECVNDVIEEFLDTTALKVWGNYLESYRTTKDDQTRSGGYLPHL